MADYISSGTVSVTNASATITGTSTTWVTDGVRAGDTIWIQPASGAPVSYPLTAVASATSLTIGFNYAGTTNTGLSYKIERRFDQEKAADTYRLLNDYISQLEKSSAVGMSGVLYTYSSTTTLANPTSGKFRFNNSTVGSATAIAISDTSGETGAPNISAFLNSWDDSTSAVKGLLILKKAGSPGTFAIFTISALTDNSGWSQLTISYVTGAGSFVDEDLFRVEFYRTGDKGVDGFSPGKRFRFSTTTTDGDPGAGYLRLNNATAANATQIFVDNTDFAGASAIAWLNRIDNFGDVNDRGVLLIQKWDNADIYLEYLVSGSVADGTGYRKITVSHLASAGSLANNGLISINFLPSGVSSSGDFKADGSVPLTGTLDANGNDITSAGAITAESLTLSSVLHVDDRLTGGLTVGSTAPGGSNDWNAAINARSGMGQHLLFGSDPNGPTDEAHYYYPMTFEFAKTDGTGNMTQFAIPYVVNISNSVWFRTRSSGTWTSWVMLTAGDATGSIQWFAMNTAPAGWLKCNGAAISRTAYRKLFAKIGTTFGAGNGSTTFNIPDLRGEFLRGWDDDRGIDPGRDFGSAQLDAFQGHKHRLLHETQGKIQNDNTTNGFDGLGSGSMHDSLNAGIPFTDGFSGTPRTATETRPRNIALLPCIKF